MAKRVARPAVGTVVRMKGRYVHRISRADVGARVSVRRWVADGDGRVPSDVVGHLDAWDGDVLTIRTRRGDLVRVDEGDILASKVIPAPPPRPGGR